MTKDILTAITAGVPLRLHAMTMTEFSKLLEQLKELHS